ncbi:hypothetical protein NLZ15_10890 [Atlantibacter subterranea]|uniref:hypothetical protein n=1 Tax=Atlantibacter subterraneus TaxID=255519 RepID=UPI0020C31190|nr:hypothetical protein [Atlantibacter subterranea]UTJ49481.1 hypothetical protein NLZ15_10890 [Atlantibacter subterranea]
MNKAFNTVPSFRSPYGCMKKALSVMLVSSLAIFGHCALASEQTSNKPLATQVIDTKAIFSQAIDDYFSGRNREAQKGYERLGNTEYAAISAVPAAVNLVALGQYSEAQKAFANIKNSSSVRDREYAQLWDLWLTAKQWKGSDKELNKELKRLVYSQTWHLPFEKSIAGLYAGRETVDSVFSAVSAFNADAAQQQDARAEATFFAGGYLQNVKHNSASAKQLFNDNLSKLNSVSLERPFIDRECAPLNKLTRQSK